MRKRAKTRAVVRHYKTKKNQDVYETREIEK